MLAQSSVLPKIADEREASPYNNNARHFARTDEECDERDEGEEYESRLHDWSISGVELATTIGVFATIVVADYDMIRPLQRLAERNRVVLLLR